jgi:hypothetical protein
MNRDEITPWKMDPRSKQDGLTGQSSSVILVWLFGFL